MSIAAVAAASAHLCNIQNQVRHHHLQRCGQDIQVGAMTQAPTDSVKLSQGATSGVASGGPLAQALTSVGKALQSGDLSAAQRAFTWWTKVGASAVPNPNVPPMGGKLTQGLDQLGQALQSGDLSVARQAFASVQQLWQQMSATDLTPSTSATQTTSTTRLSA